MTIRGILVGYVRMAWRRIPPDQEVDDRNYPQDRSRAVAARLLQAGRQAGRQSWRRVFNFTSKRGGAYDVIVRFSFE